MPTKGRLIGGKSAKRLEQDRIAGLEAQVAGLQRMLDQAHMAYDAAVKQRDQHGDTIDALREENTQLRDQLKSGANIASLSNIVRLWKNKCERLADENAQLTARATEHIRDINRLLKDNNDMRTRLAHARQQWNGDSGDVVDFERKLDALFGDDATALLRKQIDYLRRMFPNRSARL